MSHTDGGEVGLTDENFDTDSCDPFSIVEGRGAVSGFANHNPNKMLAILPTKSSGLYYDLRCIRPFDQPHNQSSDRPVIRM